MIFPENPLSICERSCERCERCAAPRDSRYPAHLVSAMKRTPLLVLLVLAGTGLLRAAPPNIVFIVSDDQLWSDYSFMGSKDVRTPNLDRLAAQSLTYTRGYVPSSLCCPSLASMITGQYPHHHKVTSNDPPFPTDGTPKKQFNKSKGFGDGREVMNRYMDAAPSLPRMLAQKGYLSLQTGKWWQGNFSRGGFTHGMTRGERHGDEGLDIGRKTMQPIYDFIALAQKEQKPFFVWYAPMLPHQPHNPPERLLEKYRAKTPSLPVAKYWAMVEWFDETCGQLLDHLDQKGLSNDTIIVYLSDNGWITNPQTGAYADKSKQSQYDGGLRTPIMLRWPARITPQRSTRLASSIDLAPTLLKAAGVPVPASMSGLDLFDSAAVNGRDTIYGECFTHNSMDLNRPAASLRYRWLIEGDWKLIVPATRNEPTATVELYQLDADPTEMKNLAAGEKERVYRLQTKLDAWWNGK